MKFAQREVLAYNNHCEAEKCKIGSALNLILKNFGKRFRDTKNGFVRQTL